MEKGVSNLLTASATTSDDGSVQEAEHEEQDNNHDKVPGGHLGVSLVWENAKAIGLPLLPSICQIKSVLPQLNIAVIAMTKAASSHIRFTRNSSISSRHLPNQETEGCHSDCLCAESDSGFR